MPDRWGPGDYKRHRAVQVAGLLPCPNGCGCVTEEDPDARDCACDGPCCFGEDWPIRAAGSAPESGDPHG